MKRRERILEYIEKITAQDGDGIPTGVTATEIATALSIWRNDATVELNKLVDEGVLFRTGKKNIQFYLNTSCHGAQPETETRCLKTTHDAVHKSQLETVFSKLVGADGSLKYQIYVAKAAVSYPPYGLNILITGPTGSGKTLFAKTIWEYAREQRNIPENSDELPFVHFNCAEYADNPQLLLSNLFGHRKGAFTGAVADKVGLVEEADGGILFLDEIHNLSAVGQELFFALLDTGKYRRIGDNVNRESHFMLIGATTKSVTDTLLDTFVRRIPVVIQMPNLTERPLSERKAFIERAYSLEAAKIRRSISVDRDVLNALIRFSSVNGIGALKNVIQISCAKSLLRERMMRGSRSNLEITYSDLSFQAGSFDDTLTENGGMISWFDRGAVFDAEHSYDKSKAYSQIILNTYEYVENLVQNRGSEIDGIELTFRLKNLISEYHDCLASYVSSSGITSIQEYVSSQVVQIAATLLRKASEKFDCVYGSYVYVLLAMHLNQYIERAKQGQPVYFPGLQSALGINKREAQIITENREWLQNKCGVKISDDEIGYLSAFLRQTTDNEQVPAIWITVCSANISSQSKVSGFISNFNNSDSIHFVNLNPYNSDQECFSVLCSNITLFHGASGNIVLTDSIYDSELSARIFKNCGVPCKVIPMVEQSLIVEACKVVMTSETNLDRAYHTIGRNYLSRTAQFFERLGVSKDDFAAAPMLPQGKSVIFAVCVTGIGSANSIKRVLEKTLSRTDVEIIPVSILDDMGFLVKHYGRNLKIVIGTVNPQLSEAPFVQADMIFSPAGLSLITSVLDGCVPHSQTDSGKTALGELDTLMEESMEYLAPHVERDAAVFAINDMISLLESTVYHAFLKRDVKARVFMHSASMLERMATQINLEMDEEYDEKIAENLQFFETLEENIDTAFKRFGEISRVEKYFYMLSLPKPDDYESLITYS